MATTPNRIMIRNKDTGQFSTGGARPKWVDACIGRPKIWRTIGHARAHLTQLETRIERARSRSQLYGNRCDCDELTGLSSYLSVAEIVEVQLVVTTTHPRISQP